MWKLAASTFECRQITKPQEEKKKAGQAFPYEQRYLNQTIVLFSNVSLICFALTARCMSGDVNVTD